MKQLKIASWNINGIKARAETLKKWLEKEQPDILCLQEIKSTDETFPLEFFNDLGYHIETHGQKSFNGVAIFSKNSPIEVTSGLDGDPDDLQARYLEALFDINGTILRIASLYCPNGNPVNTEKYSYKCKWMDRLELRIKELLEFEEKAIFIGDYNIIPTRHDAKNPDDWVEDALFLTTTRQYYHRLLNLGLTDAIRSCTDEPAYTFWDYQARSWQRNNGIRIDHALISPEVVDILKHAYVQKEVRDGEKPSDHVPIWLVLETE